MTITDSTGHPSYEYDDVTEPGTRTIIGPIIAMRKPAPCVAMSVAKRGGTLIIPPRRRIPVEWGIPELTLTLIPEDT